MNGEKVAIEDKIQAIIGRIKIKKFKRYEAEIAVRKCFLPAITHKFAISTFTRDKIKSIQKPFYKHAMSIIGYKNTISLRI